MRLRTCRNVPKALAAVFGRASVLTLVSGCGSSTRGEGAEEGTSGRDAGTAGAPANGGRAGANGQGGAAAGSPSAGSAGVNGASGERNVGGAGGNVSGAGGQNTAGATAGEGGAGGGPFTSCPPTMATGYPCSGSFVCNYQDMCTACGCCFGGTECRDGVMAFLGYNDGCLQCPGAGGNGGSAQGGAAGSAGAGGAGGTEEPPDLSECEAPMPCDEVTESIGELTLRPTDVALRCVIQALHDRTPGLYVHTSTIAGGLDTTHTSSLVYLVKADGSVQRIGKSGDAVSLAQSCSLLPPTSYESCLESVATGLFATPECEDTPWTANCVDGAVSCE